MANKKEGEIYDWNEIGMCLFSQGYDIGDAINFWMLYSKEAELWRKQLLK